LTQDAHLADGAPGLAHPPEMSLRVDVLLPRRLQSALAYTTPDPELVPGDFVAVPLGKREEIGCVWDAAEVVMARLPADLAFPPPKPVDPSRLRPVSRRIDAPGLPETLRCFVDWVSAYTLAPQGMVLAMAMRGWTPAPPKSVRLWRLASPGHPPKLTAARQKVLDAASAKPMSIKALAEKAGVSPAVISACIKLNLLEAAPAEPAFRDEAIKVPQPPTLSASQETIARSLRDIVRKQQFEAILLEGVTGSGKTEVYLEAVQECLTLERQSLVLLPEIALSTQWISRFTRRFGFAPLVWHSSMGDGHRRRVWQHVRSGAPCVVVGARSALFLPFTDLGLIIVDEEHEPAFKQEEGVIYHGRDMAVLRARQATVPVMLVSATPSLETLANVQAGRYRHLVLPDRHAGAALPDVRALDMRLAPPSRGQFLSPTLLSACRETLARGEQAMLFLNRRGYAPLTLCRQCGHRIECPKCTAWLVEHRAQRRMVCHHCEYTMPIPTQCPSCAATESLVPVGPGIERVTEEVQRELAGVRILVMSSDSLVSAEAARIAVTQIAQQEVDLIIGTQLVAKGWHFPHLTLVGVVDADLGLNGGDLRAAERTVQLLQQVGGRAGREARPGTVLLQTYLPDHPAMKALVSQDFHHFMTQEAANRRPGFWPPFGRLAALIVSAGTPESADALARALSDMAPKGEGLEVLGPAPAPLTKLRGRHRRRLLLRTRKGIAVQPLLRLWLQKLRLKSDQKIVVDIDPVSFF